MLLLTNVVRKPELCMVIVVWEEFQIKFIAKCKYNVVQVFYCLSFVSIYYPDNIDVNAFKGT